MDKSLSLCRSVSPHAQSSAAKTLRELKGIGRVHEVANRIKRKLGREFDITESADKLSWNFKRVK